MGEGKGQMYAPFCLEGDFVPSCFQAKFTTVFLFFIFFKKNAFLLEEILSE